MLRLTDESGVCGTMTAFDKAWKIMKFRIVGPNDHYADMPEGTPMHRCGVEVCDEAQPYGEGAVCDRCSEIAGNHGPGASKSSPEHDERICDYGDCMKPAVGVNAGEGSASYLCEEHWDEYF